MLLLAQEPQKRVRWREHLSALRHCKSARHAPCLPKPGAIQHASTRAQSSKMTGLHRQRETERLPKTAPRAW